MYKFSTVMGPDLPENLGRPKSSNITQMTDTWLRKQEYWAGPANDHSNTCY